MNRVDIDFETWIGNFKQLQGSESEVIEFCKTMPHPENPYIVVAFFKTINPTPRIDESGKFVKEAYLLSKEELLQRVDTLFEQGLFYPDVTFKALDELEPGLGQKAKQSYQEACQLEYNAPDSQRFAKFMPSQN